MRIAMPFVTVGRENSAAVRIYYEDHGSGPPVVLIHGYALNGQSWEKQETALLAAGHRVITYDRRGFGASSRPSTGYDFDTLAADLHVLLSRLDLRGVVLAGFAMGSGEIIRYLAAHGSERVRAAALVAPLLPFLLKTSDSPEGIDQSVFDGITARIAADRPAAMKDFIDRSYNMVSWAVAGSATRPGRTASTWRYQHRPTPPSAASQPARKTSGAISPRSASPSW
jgi:non-heme chloroperoxidase